MAHKINYNDQTGKFSSYSVKEVPWHGLGHIANNYEMSREVLEHAGLNYTVEKAPNIHRLPGGPDIISENSFFTFRTDNQTVLGPSVGKEYTILQNIDAFAFFDAIAGKDGVFYETAGALGAGEIVYITAKMPHFIKVGSNDITEMYVFLTSSHDGKGSVVAGLTPSRVVCYNTLNAALANCTHRVTIRHTSNIHDRLREAHKVMGMVNTLTPLLEQVFNHWAQVRITDKEVKKLIRLAMAPSDKVLAQVKGEQWEALSSQYKNITEDVFEYAMQAEAQQLDTTRNTLYGCYNAVTGYFQNVRKYGTPDEKMKSILYGGTAQQRGQAAFDLCSEYVTTNGNILQMN